MGLQCCTVKEPRSNKIRTPSLSRAGALALCACAASLLFTGCAGEHPGLAAYRQGDYGATLREFGAGDDPMGDVALGTMLYHGEGVSRDPAQAAVRFRRAAVKGH